MQWATLGKSGSEAASQLQGRIARAFSSNSLVNTVDMMAAIKYISTAAQSLGSHDYASVNSKHQHPPPGDPQGFALYCCPGAGIYT